MSDNDIKNNMISIGEIRLIEDEQDIVWTILGSCISVIFYTQNNLSLICHAQMPTRDKYKSICADSCPHPCFNFLPDSMEFKFVNCSIEYMIDIMKKRNVNLRKVHTTLIGGASIIDKINDFKTIGEQNVEKAKELLDKHIIYINRELTGGKEGYTIWFNSTNNRIFYRRHGNNEKIELK